LGNCRAKAVPDEALGIGLLMMTNWTTVTDANDRSIGRGQHSNRARLTAIYREDEVGRPFPDHPFTAPAMIPLMMNF
jgi:hypothetical protein